MSNIVDPTPTDADTDPVEICDKFKPVIPDAGIFVNCAPDPENEAADNEPETLTDPVNLAAPILINVFELDTINEPVITVLPITEIVGAALSTEPEKIEDPVITNPEFELIVPATPCIPLSPRCPDGPGEFTTTTFVFVFVVTKLVLILLLLLIF
jgi:hypothetical protein